MLAPEECNTADIGTLWGFFDGVDRIYHKCDGVSFNTVKGTRMISTYQQP